jgi:Tol biopolymer transport system component
MRIVKTFIKTNRPLLNGLACLFFLISCSPSGSSAASTQTSSVPVEVEDLFAQTRFLFVGSYNQKGSGIFILARDARYAYKFPNELAKFSMWASLSANGQEILFDSGGDIFLAEINTKDVKLLISDPALDSKPVWSPSGDRFAFEQDNGTTILVGDRNGSVETLISANADGSFNLGNWGPDGNEIILTELVLGTGQEGVPIAPHSHIIIVNLETGKSRLLFDPGDRFEFDQPRNPVFAPNGEIVAFQAISDGHIRIFLSDIDGKNIEELTSVAGDYFNPVWSPDGQYILAFTGGDIDNYYSIFSIEQGILVHSINGLDGLITEWVLAKEESDGNPP